MTALDDQIAMLVVDRHESRASTNGTGDALGRNEFAHQTALNMKKGEPMQGHEGRIRDLESDTQALAVHLDETARAVRDLRLEESGASRAVEDLARELREQVAELREFEENGRRRTDTISGSVIMLAEGAGQRMDKLMIGLLALGALSFAEGVAIIILWVRR